MAIVIPRQIRDIEFGKKIPADAKTVLIRAAKVSLSTPIASKALPPATRLLKAYATSPQGPRRIVYLLAVADGTLFLLFYRDKNDSVGENISPKNSAFSSQLKKHLALLHEDLVAGDFEEIPTK